MAHQPEVEGEPAAGTRRGTPRVWVLTDDRPGSTSQSIGLARALGWPFEVKPLAFGPLAALSNRLLDARGGSRAGLRAGAAAALAPPWPDLVIAAGRRTAPVAQWIRRRAGGRPRLVQLGRKGGDLAERFDLVVSPEYGRLHPHPKRMEIRAPLHGVSPERLAGARERWRRELAALPSPRLAVLVGGTSGQYRLDPAGARRLGRDVAQWALRRGGSLLLSTSRRTGPRSEAALLDAVATADAGGPPHFAHLWSRAARADPAQNPYLGILAWADEIAVTADSESMLAEAAATGRPLRIYPLPMRASFRALQRARDRVAARAEAALRPDPPPLARAARRAIDRGWVRPTRDLARLHGHLFDSGRALPFGTTPAPPGPPEGGPRGAPGPPPGAAAGPAELERVVDRVRALFPGA